MMSPVNDEAYSSLMSDVSVGCLRFCHSRPKMNPSMKEIVVNRMIEETIAMTRPIISLLDELADPVKQHYCNVHKCAIIIAN